MSLGFEVSLGMLVRLSGPDIPDDYQDEVGVIVRIDEVGDLDVLLRDKPGVLVRQVHIEEIDTP